MLKRYFIQILLLTAAVLVGVLAVRLYLPEYYLSQLPYLPFFFAVVSYFTYLIVFSKGLSNHSAFYRNFMMVFGIKFLLYLIAFVLFALQFRENIKPFTISYFLLYIIYTVFGVSQLLKLSKSIGQ